MSKTEYELFARCASGFEAVLATELRELRLRRVRPLKGGVAFFGSLADAYRACMWSRVATRIQLVLARVAATDAQTLYDAVRALPWDAHVRKGATVAVDAHGLNDNLRNTKFTALKVKDALCDALRDSWGARPNVDAKNPDFELNVALHAQKATIYLNLSGASLHRRGYRQDGVQTAAPLKETLAAGMLLAAGWPRMAQKGGALVDPMCGSGTIAIEGALMATHRAPGLLRERWGFEGWASHREELWSQVMLDALTQVEDKPDALVLAGDIDPSALGIARQNAKRAGVLSAMRIFEDDAAKLGRHLKGRRFADAPGLLATNPPYGERLLCKEDLPQIDQTLAQAAQALPAGWTMVLVSPNTSIDTALGRTPHHVLECHNGPIRTYLRTYAIDEESRHACEVVSLAGVQTKVSVAEKNSEQFAARLRKASKGLLRWARKSGVTCLRVYDADLPDYALSVDLYLGVGKDEGRRAVVVQEHRRPASVDARRAERRLADACAVARAVLDVSQKGLVCCPWRGEASARTTILVSEKGYLFVPELGAPYQTGLPLWQRGVRELVEREAAGLRFANLFDSSCAATVCAATGGARSTVTLNGFAHDAQWAERAMTLNGIVGGSHNRRHRFVRADARTWIDEQTPAGHAYGLVLCVLPSWLPARDASEADWELGRDGMALVTSATGLLEPGGKLVVAWMDKSFKLDVAALEQKGLAVRNMSAQTLPHDFGRSAKEYRCFVISRDSE
ncbi:MAG: bifunctional 23S rRNA (guanine(2069)-N(7))-methyltransferase RlmK/23S rRNA (guanine(2445)-N(2))-methyltransferase RlmL [Coriobacteriales bacterium]|nr:bifunctional 23S rRNA (guanine(2069)-N(7))-methyltransferase RlmK/23S rRNA (guanine(2445)-N(2))-methyltransferase RlmL [Coriobacteriales bacterium]